MSITDELRKWAKSLYVPNGESTIVGLGRIADRIDAEYDKARQRWMGEVDALREERDEYLDSTKLWEDKCSTMVELPRDADGEVIRIGDVVEEVDYDGHNSVYELRLTDGEWWVFAGGIGRRSSKYRHYKQPTVEDLLCEMFDAVDDDRYGQDRIIAEYAAKLRLAGDREVQNGNGNLQM